jgi:cytochrome c oxidase assembly protein subunit 15
MIPEAEHKKTWVEFSHRLTSGLFGLLVIYLYVAGRKLAPKGTTLRKALFAVLVFMITEALLGAKLVLFGLVGNNDSFFRLFAMGLHQVNSLILSGSVAMVALFSSDLPARAMQAIKTAGSQRTLPKWTVGFLVLFTLVAITGAFASLSSTLFPSASVLEGIAKDFAPDAHYLLRIRISHPIMATLIGGGLALFFWFKSQDENNEVLRKSTLQAALIFIVAVVFGYLTLFSLAPIWMKVSHLLIAHLVWIILLRWYVLKKLTR